MEVDMESEITHGLMTNDNFCIFTNKLICALPKNI
jgi:hypothetical protein